MKILGYDLSFQKAEVEEKEKGQAITFPLGDIAWAEDSMYNGMKNMPKYNPDALITKKGHAIYRTMMIDEQVKAVVRFKRDAITSRKILIEVDEEELGEKEAEHRKEVGEAIISNQTGSFTDALNGIMSSMYQGFSVTEKVYTQFEHKKLTFWGIEKLKLKPFDTFEFVVDDFGNIIQVTQNLNGKEIAIPISKFIHFVHNPEYDEHYGQSELREAYRAWFSKDMIIRFWNMWLEKHASGFKWVNPTGARPLTKGTPEYTALQDVLSNTVNGAGFILPQGLEFNVQFPTNNVAFKEAIEFNDLSIAKALLVPNLLGVTPQGQTGSYAQSSNQLVSFMWTLKADTNRLEEAINEQMFKELGEANFNDPYWPKMKFQTLTDDQLDKIIRSWSELVGKGAVTPSDTDEKKIREMHDMPPKGTPNIKPQEPGTEAPKKNDPGKKPDESEPPDETISGKAKEIKYSQKTLDKARKRVDFSVINSASMAIEGEYAEEIALVLFEATKTWIDSVQDVAIDTIIKSKVKFDSGSMKKLNRKVTQLLKDGWKLGQKHAENEVDKAKGTAFSLGVNRKRLEFVSVNYIKARALKAAGNIADSAKHKIENIILNGAKYGWAIKQIEQEIYKEFGIDGLLPESIAKDLLGEPTLKNPRARIDTLTRTSLFESLNEARYSYFTDPKLDDFVEALEYSAIMDMRVTEICSHLDGRVFETGSAEWDRYRPPNHYNCRSVLIPVTENDIWVESEEPTKEPQRGFG